LLALIHEPSLWRRYAGDAESMLFRRGDLVNPSESQIFGDLADHRVSDLQERANFMLTLLSAKIEQIPYLQGGSPALVDVQTQSLSGTPKESPLPDWVKGWRE
jgi:hypothetical protein